MKEQHLGERSMPHSIFEFQDPGGFLKVRYLAMKEAEPGSRYLPISIRPEYFRKSIPCRTR